jgi:hypothetical protein
VLEAQPLIEPDRAGIARASRQLDAQDRRLGSARPGDQGLEQVRADPLPLPLGMHRHGQVPQHVGEDRDGLALGVDLAARRPSVSTATRQRSLAIAPSA